jgi:hypothetical protein
MTKRLIFVAATTALALVVGVATTYTSTFGTHLASSQDLWGQFGDYFGGILNPLFSMLAFLALLWSIVLQREEFHKATEHLSTQSELSRKQLSNLEDERMSQELLHVIKDIDTRLDVLLLTDVSPPEVASRISITLMVAESERIAIHGGQSPAYTQFVSLAQSPGSFVEAPVREIALLTTQMREFLESFSRFRTGSYAPVIVYYANKVYRLLHMLEDIGCVPEDTRKFYATISDKHH